MNKLNQQYFDTKRKHRRSVHKKAWIIWLVFIGFGVVWLYNEISSQLEKPLTEKAILNRAEEFELVESDFIFVSKEKDFEINIKKGFYFGKVNNEMPLMIMSIDSTETALYVKRTKTDKDYKSLIEHWESKIRKTDSTYKFTNIIDKSTSNLRKEIASVQLTKNEKEYYGKIMICQRDNDIFIIQGITRRKYWDSKKNEIIKIVNSFKIQ